MHIDDSFYGIFNRKGELEAVESTEIAAYITACNLSPYTGGKPPSIPVGKVVEPITVIRGDVAEAIANLIEIAASSNIVKLYEEYKKLLKRCTHTDEKSGKPVVIPTNDLLTAKERLRTAVEFQRSVTGEQP